MACCYCQIEQTNFPKRTLPGPVQSFCQSKRPCASYNSLQERAIRRGETYSEEEYRPQCDRLGLVDQSFAQSIAEDILPYQSSAKLHGQALMAQYQSSGANKGC